MVKKKKPEIDEQFMLESAHLEMTINRLDTAIKAMLKDKTDIEMQRQANSRYLNEEMGSAPGDFLQAVEFSQTLQAEKQLLEQRGYHDQQRVRYEHLKAKPYFARIDYTEAGARQEEVLYIGYGNFMDPKSLEIYIYDWRTPIASLFYDFGIGPVHYFAPDGLIHGVVGLKRQFEIKNAQLLAYYDAKEHVVDERLLSALADRKAGPMHQIVETIQAEQNRIIRERKSDVLFVEGVAGSGKTIVALHRIAYLLYHGLKNSLSSQQVMILSPNAMFSEYISHVIPELGEEEVNTLTLQEMLSLVMKAEIATESFTDRIERDLTGKITSLEGASIALKSDPRILEALKETMGLFEKKGIKSVDFHYGNERLSTAAAMRKAMMQTDRPRPLMKRLERFGHRVRAKVKDIEKRHYAELLLEVMLSGKHPFDYKAVARLERFKRYKRFSESLDAVMTVSGLDVYKWMLSQPKLLYTYFDDLSPKQIKEICEETLEALSQERFSLEDWLLIAWFQMALYGEHPLSAMRQVVIDESQDYSPFGLSVIKTLFPQGRFTILGDSFQRVDGIYLKSRNETSAQLMQTEKVAFSHLNVAYRNSEDIGNFCLKILGKQEGFEVVPRTGEALEVYTGDLALQTALKQMLNKNFALVAVLTKTRQRAQELHAQVLKTYPDAVLIKDGEEVLKGSVVVMPVYLAKGMEFDGVIIGDAEATTYTSERDRQLLYIAASRGLHALAFVSETQALSPLLTEAGLGCKMG